MIMYHSIKTNSSENICMCLNHPKLSNANLVISTEIIRELLHNYYSIDKIKSSDADHYSIKLRTSTFHILHFKEYKILLGLMIK